MTKGAEREGSGAPAGFPSLSTYCSGKESVGKQELHINSWSRRLAGLPVGMWLLEMLRWTNATALDEREGTRFPASSQYPNALA